MVRHQNEVSSLSPDWQGLPASGKLRMRRLLAVLLIACAAAPCRAQSEVAPAKQHAIVASDRRAAEAGLQMLREGGSAADAVVAAQMVLAVVAPQSTGLGGGGVALSYTQATQDVLAWDGLETAPAAAGPDLFLGRDGQPMPYPDAALGGRAVGVPGVVRMLEALHKAQGKLAWEHVLAPAIDLAEGGFAVSPGLAAAIADNAEALRRQPEARGVFLLADGSPAAAGAVLVNKKLAETLRAIAVGGADALLHGAIASDIATVVRNDSSPGLLTADDLAAYSARSHPALCGAYRGVRVCGMVPPSAGGVKTLQILGLLEHFNLTRMSPTGPQLAHLLLEAEKRGDADRDMYLADPEFVPVPEHDLLAPATLTAQALQIDLTHADPVPPSPAPPQPEHGIGAVVAIDDAGNAVSLTSTVHDPFGARLMVHGFFLNDQLTNFAFTPEIDGKPVANRVEGGKRPRSSMAPSMVLAPDGALRIATSVAGGGRIVDSGVQALVGMIDFGLPPQQALAIMVTTNGLLAGTDRLGDGAALGD
jgi:gamma-glutamyltranspeptidase/glutathione hydrolase